MAPTYRLVPPARRGTTFIALLIITVMLFATSTARALTTATLWSRSFGSAGMEDGMAVACDPAGNVYVAGYFTNTVDFGGGPLTSAGAEDIFVAKYNSMGVHLWSKRFGGTGSDEANGMWVDPSGMACVTGYFNSTVDFGGNVLTSAGGSDIFVLRLSWNGAYYSSQRFGGSGADVGYSAATDGEYGFVVCGSFSGSVDFGGGMLNAAGGTDIFLAYYTPTMSLRWAKQLGGTANDIARRLVIDGPANVIVTGEFGGTVDFGGGPLTSAGGQDGFLAKYDYNGNHVWSRRMGGTGSDRGYSVAVDQFANVLVCGNFSDTVDFGGGNLTSAGIYDVFLAKYNNNGVHQWSRRFGSTTNDMGYALATDAADNVVLTGFFSGNVDFGAGVMVSAGGGELFVAKYNSSGVCQWSQRYGDDYDERGRSVATDAAGNIVMSGSFDDTVDLGTGSMTNTGTSSTWDIFLAKFTGAVAEPVISAITDIPNDQGRKVRIRFARAGADAGNASIPVTSYVAFRRDDAAPAALAAQDLATLPLRALLANGWTEVGSVGAYGEATYGIDVPTIGDSTITLGQYFSRFYVRAATDVPTRFYDSPVDSGYSLDNLAPGVPANLAFHAGELSWKESTAKDFDYFTVYGGNTDSFGAATLVNYSTGTAMNVSASPYVYYFVTATDFSGNEGKPAKINSLTGVGGTPSSYVLSVSNYPNPFNPRTTVRYTVPSRGEVTVTIYDARGSFVKMLFNGVQPAGAYSVEWDGHADNGDAVASGLYFARIEQGGAVRTRKMVLLK